MTASLPSKICRVCGRRFHWRKRWARVWSQVRYCSDHCRRRGLRPKDREIEQKIMELLSQRNPGATICPSEVARAIDGQRDGQAWRAQMEPVRMAARRLVDQGHLEILQGGRIVDPSTAKGPIRLRLSQWD